MSNAYEIPGKPRYTLPAGQVFAAANQFIAVKVNSSGQAIAVAASTDIPVGVVQDTQAYVGAPVTVWPYGITKMLAGGEVTAGTQVMCDTSGRAITAADGTSAGNFVLGTALTGSSASGQIISVLLQYVGFLPAAAS